MATFKEYILFTGIIESVGRLVKTTKTDKGAILEIDAEIDLSQDSIGDSFAVDGACLTITEKNKTIFKAAASAETIARSTLGSIKAGSKVNIERALTLSKRLGGHIVQGHVDCVGTIIKSMAHGESTRLRISFDKKFNKYVIEKGSVAIDGISLTVNETGNDYLEVNIIPHTGESTSLTARKAGDRVNVEFDVLGKYIEKLVQNNADGLANLLKKQGFM